MLHFIIRTTARDTVLLTPVSEVNVIWIWVGLEGLKLSACEGSDSGQFSHSLFSCSAECAWLIFSVGALQI